MTTCRLQYRAILEQPVHAIHVVFLLVHPVPPLELEFMSGIHIPMLVAPLASRLAAGSWHCLMHCAFFFFGRQDASPPALGLQPWLACNSDHPCSFEESRFPKMLDGDDDDDVCRALLGHCTCTFVRHYVLSCRWPGRLWWRRY